MIDQPSLLELCLGEFRLAFKSADLNRAHSALIGSSLLAQNAGGLSPELLSVGPPLCHDLTHARFVVESDIV